MAWAHRVLGSSQVRSEIVQDKRSAHRPLLLLTVDTDNGQEEEMEVVVQWNDLGMSVTVDPDNGQEEDTVVARQAFTSSPQRTQQQGSLGSEQDLESCGIVHGTHSQMLAGDEHIPETLDVQANQDEQQEARDAGKLKDESLTKSLCQQRRGDPSGRLCRGGCLTESVRP